MACSLFLSYGKIMLGQLHLTHYPRWPHYVMGFQTEHSTNPFRSLNKFKFYENILCDCFVLSPITCQEPPFPEHYISTTFMSVSWPFYLKMNPKKLSLHKCQLKMTCQRRMPPLVPCNQLAERKWDGTPLLSHSSPVLFSPSSSALLSLRWC